MRSYFFLILLTLANFLLSACASRPRLADYPRRQIDRPYTLPATLAAWEPTSGIETTRDNIYGNSGAESWVNPFSVRTALSDDWNLLWNILPLGAQHQFIYDEKNILGLSFGISGFSISSVEGLEVRPYTSVFYQIKLGANAAVLSALEYTAIVNNNYSGYSVTLNTGPLFQILETFALSPRILFSEQSDYSYYSNNQSPLIYEPGPNFVIPLGLRLMWSVSRNWDLNGEYRYTAIGARNNWVDNLFTGNAAFTW